MLGHDVYEYRLMNIIRTKTQTRVAIGLAAVAIPVGYVIKKHLDWESTPEAKSRMLTHQLSFWTATGLGLWGLHKTFRSVIPLPLKILGTVLAAALPVVGFEGGQRLGVRLFPKKPVVLNRNFGEHASTRLFPGRVYVPPPLRNQNLGY